MAFELQDGMKEIDAGIDAGNVAVVRRLLHDKPHLAHVETFLSPSWLHDAAKSGIVEMIKVFLDLGLDINKVDHPAETSALVCAINKGHVRAVRYLLSRGADPNIGRPLISAINRDEPSCALELVKLLVDHGADLNRFFPWFGDESFGFTPLTFAEAHGKTEIAEYLRSKGAVLPPPQPKKVPANREQEIVVHFEKQFGPVRPAALREIVPSGLPVAIHVIPPTENHQQLTLFTTGMSEHAMDVPERCDDYRYAELVIHLPADWPLTKKSLGDPKYNWPFRWLQETARYPRENQTWLGGPFTIIASDPPQRLAPNTKLAAMMLAAKSEMHCADGRLIQLYTLVPLYPEERELEIKKDLPTLMRALDRHDISDVVDLNRPNVAKGESSVG